MQPDGLPELPDQDSHDERGPTPNGALAGTPSEIALHGEAGPTARPANHPSLPPSHEQIIEAMLFVGGEPLAAELAMRSIRGLSMEQFAETISTLNRRYRRQGRPYTIQLRERGHVLTLRSRFRPVLERLYGPVREARLSHQAIDVLSLVAYRQPVSRQDVDAIRGADSGAHLRQLVRRGLIAVVGRGAAGHKEVTYGTTQRFLEFFNLTSLDDLPQTQDLQVL